MYRAGVTLLLCIAAGLRSLATRRILPKPFGFISSELGGFAFGGCRGLFLTGTIGCDRVFDHLNLGGPGGLRTFLRGHGCFLL